MLRIALVPQLVPTVLNDKRSVDVTDLWSVDLRTVVALIAARRVGIASVSLEELYALTGVRPCNMGRLERQRWVMCVGKHGNTKLWTASPHAAPKLELAGWQTLLFTAEELPRVDPNVPGFLLPAGPTVIDTTGEPVAERAAS